MHYLHVKVLYGQWLVNYLHLHLHYLHLHAWLLANCNVIDSRSSERNRPPPTGCSCWGGQLCDTSTNLSALRKGVTL